MHKNLLRHTIQIRNYWAQYKAWNGTRNVCGHQVLCVPDHVLVSRTYSLLGIRLLKHYWQQENAMHAQNQQDSIYIAAMRPNIQSWWWIVCNGAKVCARTCSSIICIHVNLSLSINISGETVGYLHMKAAKEDEQCSRFRYLPCTETYLYVVLKSEKLTFQFVFEQSSPRLSKDHTWIHVFSMF